MSNLYGLVEIRIAKEHSYARPVDWVFNDKQQPISIKKIITTCPKCGSCNEFEVNIEDNVGVFSFNCSNCEKSEPINQTIKPELKEVPKSTKMVAQVIVKPPIVTIIKTEAPKIIAETKTVDEPKVDDIPKAEDKPKSTKMIPQIIIKPPVVATVTKIANSNIDLDANISYTANSSMVEVVGGNEEVVGGSDFIDPTKNGSFNVEQI